MIENLSHASSFSTIRKRRTSTNYSNRVTPKKKAKKQKRVTIERENIPKPYNPSSKVTSTLSRHSSEAGLWRKKPNWDEFDLLDKHAFDEDVESVTTTMSIDAKKKSNPTDKVVQREKTKSSKPRMTQNFNYRTSEKKSKKKGRAAFDYEGYKYFDSEDNVPVSVVFQEVDSNFLANMIPESRKPKASPNRENNEEKNFRKSRIKPYQDTKWIKKMPPHGDFMIKMEDSFNGDLIKQSNGTINKSIKSKPKGEQNNENDETLSLSPIK